MSSSFNEENLVKKLEHVTNSQDSIQTLSLWVLHHKNHYKKIVEAWLKVYTKAKTSHKLALFYLANDVVQHAKRKSLLNYLNEFKEALKEAIKQTNDDKIIPNINRVLSIWEERGVYSKDFIDSLKDTFCDEELKYKVISKIVKEYSINEVISKINSNVKVEQHTHSRLTNLVNCKVDFSNPDLLNKLKDKTYGEQFTKEFDEATKCLESVIAALEKEVKDRKELLVALEKSRIYYDIQLKEATTLVNRFTKCELGVQNVRNKINGVNGDISSLNNVTSLGNISSSSVELETPTSSMSQPVSSLDQRLTSLMSGFGLNLNSGSMSYNPAIQSYNPSTFDPNLYSGQFYLDNNSGDNQATEKPNLEPADMDLGNSDEEESGKMNVVKSIDSKIIPTFPTFAQNLNALVQSLIPPPPPPPVPPRILEEMYDKINAGNFEHNADYQAGNSIPPYAHNAYNPNNVNNIVTSNNNNNTNNNNNNSNNMWPRNDNRNSNYGYSSGSNFRSPNKRFKNNAGGGGGGVGSGGGSGGGGGSWKSNRNNY